MTEKTSPAAARDIGDRPTFRAYALLYPKEYEGRAYREIRLVRLTAADVEAYLSRLDALMKENPEAKVRLPIFRDEVGAPVPDGLMDILDDDDLFELEKASEDFLPRRFHGLKASA